MLLAIVLGNQIVRPLLLLGIARINRRIPGALIVLILSTAAMFVFHLTDDGVAVLGPLLLTVIV